MSYLLGSTRALRILPCALRCNRLGVRNGNVSSGGFLSSCLRRTFTTGTTTSKTPSPILAKLRDSEFKGPHFDKLVNQIEQGDAIDINTFNLTLRGIAKLNPSFSWEIYSNMLEVHDLNPDIQTYSIVLPVLYVLGDIDRVINVYSDMTERGIELNYSVRRVMLRVWTEIEHTDQALLVLDQLTSIDPKILEQDKASTEIMRSYNKLARSEIRRNNTKQVTTVFYSALNKRLLPQLPTIEVVFNYWAQQKDRFHLADAFSILTTLKQGNSIEIYNIYLKALADMREIDTGRQIWDQLVGRNLHPTADSYNWIMNLSLLKEDHKSTLIYYEEMISRGILPTVKVYFTMIQTWSKLGLVQNALDLMAEMQRKGMVAENPRSSNETSLEEVSCHLIKMWSENGDDDSAKTLYDKLREQGVEPNKDLHNVILEIWTKRGEFHFAEKLLKVMEESDRQNTKPDESTYCLFMNAWAERGEYTQAKSIFFTMRGRGIRPSLRSYNILLSALIKQADFDSIDEMNAIWKDMQLAGIAANAEIYINQMKFWAMLKRNDKVLYTFNEMLLRGLQPDGLQRIDLYHELVNYWISVGELDIAMEFANEMIARDPCLTSYIAKIKALAARKEYGGMLRAYRDMTEEGIPPTSEFYSTMIKAWSENNLNKAMAVFKEMEEASKVNPKLHPSPSIYKTIIEIWTEHGEFDKAIKVLKLATSENSLYSKQVFATPSSNTKKEAEAIKEM